MKEEEHHLWNVMRLVLSVAVTKFLSASAHWGCAGVMPAFCPFCNVTCTWALYYIWWKQVFFCPSRCEIHIVGVLTVKRLDLPRHVLLTQAKHWQQQSCNYLQASLLSRGNPTLLTLKCDSIGLQSSERKYTWFQGCLSRKSLYLCAGLGTGRRGALLHGQFRLLLTWMLLSSSSIDRKTNH